MLENGRGSFVCGAIKHKECSGTSHYALAQVNPPRTECFFHVSCIYKSVCLFTRCVALSTWPEAWESHERMGSPGQAFLISCGESPKPGKQTFAHFFTISTWGRRQLTWGRRQLPSPCWDCINFFLPAYCEKQPGIRYWYSSIQSKLKCRGVATSTLL